MIQNFGNSLKQWHVIKLDYVNTVLERCSGRQNIISQKVEPMHLQSLLKIVSQNGEKKNGELIIIKNQRAN
jgi:hypothetical protein